MYIEELFDRFNAPKYESEVGWLWQEQPPNPGGVPRIVGAGDFDDAYTTTH